MVYCIRQKQEVRKGWSLTKVKHPTNVDMPLYKEIQPNRLWWIKNLEITGERILVSQLIVREFNIL